MRVRTSVVRHALTTAAVLAEARALLDDAFVDDPLTEHDWLHCQGGVHVLVHEHDQLVAYAAVVRRRFRLDGRPLTVGYVEGMGVRRTHQRRGFGGLVMARIESMAGCEVPALALATSDDGLPLYLARGWRPWPGRTFVMTSTGLRRTPEEDDSVMVWPEGPLATVGAESELACEEREGEDW